MYTQCPDCDTAFRVTAHDLMRAAGRVVCAGCSREFNALECLTEEPPEAAERADRKRAMLDSLNELTGPHEIRIEDTGVEWRVIEEDEPTDNPLQAGQGESGEDENSSIRWYIADLEDGTASQNETSGEAIADTGEGRRGAGAAVPDPATQEPLDGSLDDPDMSNLQESLKLRGADAQRYDDNTPLPDDFIDEGEPPVPRRRTEDRIEPRSPEADEAQVDLGFGEPEDWMELLDEVGPASGDASVDNDQPDATGEAAETASALDTLADTDIRPVSDSEYPDDESYPSDIDTQFDLQAIELGIDLTGSRNLSLEDEVEAPDEWLRLEADDEAEATLRDREHELATKDTSEDEGAVPGDGIASGEAREPAGPSGDLAEPPLADEDDAGERDREEAFEQELAAAWSTTPDDQDTDSPGETAQAEHSPPPATEDEMAINRLIDQDLIKLAEQENVFTSTTAHHKPDKAAHVETIIMEGELVRTVMDADLSGEVSEDSGASGAGDAGPEAASGTQAEPNDDDILLQTRTGSKDRIAGAWQRADLPGYGIAAGVAVLGLALAAQVVHAYRDTLATYPIFDRTAGSVYRLLGEPVVPGWNVRAWRFEATSGSTDDTDEVLTISSRIANGSAKPLPYPLLHVSLTDRWEEIIGSKVLEPAEYLAGNADPATRVNPGDNFTAVVRVEAPAPEATGFKLNVCYPETGGRLRCATEDFK
jgi:predicted Zn finger-like uncharacterized protein